MKLEGFGGFIRPTPLERAAGRLMRAPDHGDDGGGSEADAGADGGSDAGADAGDGGNDAGQADAGADKGSDADDASLLGKAGTEAGDGDGGANGDQSGKDGDDDKGATDGPPETYELKVTTQDAEGKDVDVPIDVALLEAATPILKDVGLTNEQANKLAPLALEIENRVIQTQADNFAAMKTDWAKEVKADKELGGKNWKETEALAAKALDLFGAPSVKDAEGKETNPFRALLNETGLGNHPEMIRMFRRIGEKVGEDSDFIRNQDTTATKPDRVRTLYPNDLPKEGAK